MAEKTINGVVIKKHFEENQGNRSLCIDVSEDGIQAFITIQYSANNDSNSLNVLPHENDEHKKNQTPSRFSVAELKNILDKLGINYGVIQESLEICSEAEEITELLIAEGITPVNDIDDEIKSNFESRKTDRNFEVDEHGRIDYRNVGAVTAVNKGDIIATRIIGRDGKDGIDVYGNVRGRKKKKKVNLKIGEGCTIKDDNLVVATIDGEPYIKNNTFYVYSVHVLNNDVSLETGDIQFIGDVKIFGNVLEGMRVEAGNTATIEGNTESSNIIAKGDITIKGNAMGTTISAGGKDIKLSKYANTLEEAKNTLELMMEAIINIKKDNLLGAKIGDGDMIKVLIENKFRDLPKYCWSIMKEGYDFNNGEKDSLSDIIKTKLIGMGPLLIRNYNELNEIINLMNSRLEELKASMSLPVCVRVAYCQDSIINSSGDICITGSGQYISELIAERGIYFIYDGSVCRGGNLKAGKEIICKIAGSPGGSKTRLHVGKKGVIRIDLAYPNTTVQVGPREYTFDLPSRHVHAYMNEAGELVVDRLKV